MIQTTFDQGITFYDRANVIGNAYAEVALEEILKQSPGLQNHKVIQAECGRFVGSAEEMSVATQCIGEVKFTSL